MTIKLGMEASHVHVVHEKDLATHWGGEMEVLASPVLIGLFEQACVKATDHLLPSTNTTVGVGIDVLHLSPSPSGSMVQISVRLERIRGKKLTFNAEARDSQGLVATGIIYRAIVKKLAFMEKVQEKLAEFDEHVLEESTALANRTHAKELN